MTRFRAEGEAALTDRSSRPHRSPTQTDPAVVARIEVLRRERKLPPRLIVEELALDGIEVSAATVHRWLRKLGISRLRDLDVTGNSHRVIRRIETERPGQLIHLDVKKIGAIPTGGGWRVHGRGSTQDRAARREKVGYRYWHSAVDAHTRLALTESLPDERAVTAAGLRFPRLLGCSDAWVSPGGGGIEMPAPRRSSPEVLSRAVELVKTSGRPIAHITAKLGLAAESLREAVPGSGGRGG